VAVGIAIATRGRPSFHKQFTSATFFPTRFLYIKTTVLTRNFELMTNMPINLQSVDHQESWLRETVLQKQPENR